MIGDCDTIMTPEGLDEIAATISLNKSGIRYQKGRRDIRETRGELDSHSQTEWYFTEDKPLVGMYGRLSNLGLSQIGFITLDKECQALPVAE